MEKKIKPCPVGEETSRAGIGKYAQSGELASYIASFISMDNPQLAKIAYQEESRDDVQPSIGPEIGKLLGLLIRMTRAKNVLELGTCLGYSTVWLAQALKTTGGNLVSVESNENLFVETQKNVAEAGLSDVVQLMCGDARGVLDQLKGQFDLILQDSDKALYPTLLDKCIELTREYGLIVADDALFKPRGISARLSEPIHQYNKLVFSDPRLYSVILPIGDGVTLSLKIKS